MGTFITVIFILALIFYVLNTIIKGYQEDEHVENYSKRKLGKEYSPSKWERMKSEQRRRSSKALSEYTSMKARPLKRSSLHPLKSRKQDNIKLEYCEEKHFENVDQAGIVIGGLEGIEARGYAGETLSLSKKVLVELDEGYAASTVIRDILENDYDGSISQKKTIEDLLARFDGMNEVTEQDLLSIEMAWETISERLERIDQRYKELGLAIMEYEKLALRDGMYRLNGNDWRDILSADIDAVFEQSKGDPLGAINQSLGGIENLLGDGEIVVKRIEHDRNYFKDWLTEKQPELKRKGLNDSWIISGLRDVEYDLFQQNADFVDPLKEKVSQVLRLADELESLRSKSGSYLLEMIETTEEKVARACGIDRELVFHNTEHEKEVALIDEILSLYQEALQQGDTSYALTCRGRASKRIKELKTKIEKTEEAALKGQQLHIELSKLYTEHCIELDAEIKAFDVIIEHTLPSIFQQDVIEYIERSEGVKQDLSGRLEKVQEDLGGGKFVDAILGFDHIELKLERMKNAASYLKQARAEMKEMEQNNEVLLAAAKSRFLELQEKKKHVYVGNGSDDIFIDVEDCVGDADALLVKVKQEKKQVDPRELAAKLYRIQMSLESLEASLEEDAELYEFLQQKVTEIDEVAGNVRVNLKQAATDGIEDSKLTTELIAKLTDMLEGWPKLKEKLNHVEQDWSQLRFDYDVYFHGMESINVRLEQDLNLAEEASGKTKEASELLHRVSAWRGENGMRVELVECSRIVHHAIRELNAGDYKEAIVQATYAKGEITRELHEANKKDVDTQMQSSYIRTKSVGGEMHNNQSSRESMLEE